MEPATATVLIGSLLPGRGAIVSKAGPLGALTSAMPTPPRLPQASALPQHPLRESSSDVSADMAPNDRSRVNDESESESESEAGSELETNESGEIGKLLSGKLRKNRPSEHRKRRGRGPGEATLEMAGKPEIPSGEGSGFRKVRKLTIFHLAQGCLFPESEGGLKRSGDRSVLGQVLIV